MVLKNNAAPEAPGDGNLLPLALVGMACRLPGNANNPEEFWELCSRARSGWSAIPETRFNAAAYYHPNPDRPGAFNMKGGYFLQEDIGLFDAPFFNLTMQEAQSLDPQHRLMLECTYEALENGGITFESLLGDKVGVFVGGSLADYDLHNYKDSENIPRYGATGGAMSLQSNRISYHFNFKGPSLTIDTACSSSLTALHVACQSLRSGESTLFSDSGKCYPFDHRATSGFGPGEGASCIILKPLSAAIEAGDPIRAVIVHSGVNQDGRTMGITMPSALAQENLMRSIYREARIDPSDTEFVEAHGTGTKVGDPIEAAAIHSVFGKGRTPKQPLFVGSVKSNIGHTEGASGIVSIIKTAMMLEKGFILPNCEFERPPSTIPLDEWNLKVPKKQVPWPRAKYYASVNNFGFGGSNAHVILKKAPQMPERPLINGKSLLFNGTCEYSLRRKIYTLSSHDREVLACQVKNLEIYLEKNPEVFDLNLMDNLAYTLCQRRNHFPWRIAVSASSSSELIELLASDIKPQRAVDEPVMAFVFTGQGAQWYAMGRELLGSYPVFSAALEAVDRCLESFGADFSIIEELSEDANKSRISEAYLSQPSVTAIQIALTDLLRLWGVIPTAVIGHSSGEIAAAYAAGILSMEECMRIAYTRGAVAENLAKDSEKVKGGMMAVGASAADIMPLLNSLRKGHAVVACINSQNSTTVSGDDKAVCELQLILEERSIFNRRLPVTVAYHSPHMQLVAERYLSMMGEITPKPSSIAFYSSLLGRQAPYSDLTSQYWVENFVSPVEFLAGLQDLLTARQAASGKQIDILIEIGPHPALKAPIREILQQDLASNTIRYLPSLKRDQDAIEAMQLLATSLFMTGTKLNFESVNFPSRHAKRPVLLTNLPQYPWNHNTKYWHPSRLAQSHCFKRFPRNDILGSLCLESDDIEPRWRNVIRADDHPWIRHHKVQGNNVYPLAGYLAIILEAATQHSLLRKVDFDRFIFREVSIGRQLIIPDTSQVEMMTTLRPYADSTRGSSNVWNEFRIFSWSDTKGWDEHCRGLVRVQTTRPTNPVDRPCQLDRDSTDVDEQTRAFNSACTSDADVDTIYDTTAANGVEYGSLFRGLRKVSLGDRRVITEICVPDTKSAMPSQVETDSILHPAALDSCLQIVWPLMGFINPGSRSLYLPSFIQGLSISRSISMEADGRFRVYGTRQTSLSEEIPIAQDMFVTDAKNSAEILIKIDALTCTPIQSETAITESEEPKDICYKLHIEPCFDFLHPSNSKLISDNQHIDQEEQAKIQLLNQASLYFIERALRKLDEEGYGSFHGHQESFYRWMRKQSLRSRNGMTKSPFPNWSNDDDRRCSRLIATVRSMGAVGRMSCALGESIVPILKREVEPLSIMLEDNMLEQYYNEFDSFRRNYAQAAICLDKMGHQNPNMQILEIGAGTGGVTLPVLQNMGGGDTGKIQRFSKYTYTDISSGFFEKARDKFRAWGEFITYRCLNISVDPSDQGYESNSYDLIIASNVLHATEGLDQTMTNVRKLLKPGGKLVLIEWTARHLYQFIFALLPGWWLSKEPSRHDSPILDKEAWDKLLRETNFSGIDLCLDDYSDAPEQSSSLIVSTADAPNELSGKEVVLVCHGKLDEFPVPDLVDRLRNITGIAPSIESLCDVDAKGRLCIFVGELSKPFLSKLTPDLLASIQRLLSTASGLLWVVRQAYQDPTSPESNMVAGLARTVRSESTIQFATLILEGTQQASSSDDLDKIIEVFSAIFGPQSTLRQGDMEYVVRNGLICVPRVIDDSNANKYVHQESHEMPPEPQPFQQSDRRLTLAMKYRGTLDTFYFTDEPEMLVLPDDQIEIEIRFVGLNFKDIMIAMGQLQGGKLGHECSGIVTSVGDKVTDFAIGDRVCAISEGAFSNYVRCPATNASKIPTRMSFEVAASIPIIFCTAYYSLFDVGHLQPGERILIHSGAGGVGQAAIILAQSIGAEIFTTVGSAEKKKFLMEVYKIDEQRIFFSRDISFAEGVRRATDGVGVDMALNSLAGDTLRATWECIAPFGRFVEIGKRDIVRNTRLEMIHFDRNVSFASVDLTLVADKRPQLMKRLLSDIFMMFEDGSARAISPVSRFSISALEEACHRLQSGHSIGKIVIEAERNALVKVRPKKKPGNLLLSEASYIVVGGTGGLGRAITTWLAKKGARSIVAISRSGASDPRVVQMIDELAAEGVTLTDTLFERMTYDEYDSVIKPKVDGLWNLHHTLLRLNYTLDFFINLSSIAGVVGNRGQAAYAAGSTFMTAFTNYRNALGLPCTTIDLGPVQGIGYLAENEKKHKQVETVLGVDWIDETELYALLATAMSGDMSASCQGYCITGLRGLKGLFGKEQPFWASDPRFSLLMRPHTSNEGQVDDPAANSAVESPGVAVKAAADLRSAEKIVTDALVQKVSSIMMRPVDEIDSSKPIANYGLDSLITIEVRNWISRELQANLQILEILASKSLVQLAGVVLARSKIISPQAKVGWGLS
ncbi:Type I Iterative PKS [Onygenales sp. PD_12]|nr:Type I Iterative PKS [Onygenales sp. PD_12]